MSAPRLSMYEALMGPGFRNLQPSVRAFHRLSGSHVLGGWVQTEAPATAAARFMALCMGTPRAASNGGIRFELHARDDQEVWVRRFPNHVMKSRMRPAQGGLTESLGMARLCFGLEEANGRLVMRLRSLRFLGLPCPRWAMPVIVAEEEGRGDRLHFTVRASLPLIGQVTGYCGYLVVGAGALNPAGTACTAHTAY